MTYHVRHCSSNETHLSKPYAPPCQALEAARWLWIDHKVNMIEVVKEIDGGFDVVLNEDQIKQTAMEELPGARVS